MNCDGMMRRLISGAIVLLFALSVHGEVFTLWPWKPSADEEVRRKLETLPGLSPEPLFTEKLLLNGVELTLETYRAEGDFSGLVRFLTSSFPPENLQMMGDTVRLTYLLADGRLDRWLLIYSGDDKPVTVFRITAPSELPAPEWPSELPSLPPGATPIQVIHFPGSGGWYGSFENAPEDPAGNLRRTEAELQRDNWSAASHESSFDGNGDLYLLPGGRGVAWVCYNGTRGAFYVRRRR